MNNYHHFAIFMLVICVAVRIIMGLPEDLAAQGAVVVGLAAGYVFFYNLIKFVSERMADYGLVWKWK